MHDHLPVRSVSILTGRNSQRRVAQHEPIACPLLHVPWNRGRLRQSAASGPGCAKGVQRVQLVLQTAPVVVRDGLEVACDEGLEMEI